MEDCRSPCILGHLERLKTDNCSQNYFYGRFCITLADILLFHCKNLDASKTRLTFARALEQNFGIRFTERKKEENSAEV